MDVWHAVSQYQERHGSPEFEEFVHPAISERAQPFTMRVPASFLPWDRKNGVIAMLRRDKQLAMCRCGVVLAGIYFQLENAIQSQVPVALKAMDRRQLQVQRDDVESEVRVMAQLQMAGVDAPLSNPYVIRWEHGQDAHNQYLATEFVANGSLQSYAHKKIRALMLTHLQRFIDTHGDGPTRLECVAYVYRGAGNEWMRESLEIFQGIIRGLTYLHAQGVAHLDLDIYNVAIDKALQPRIIDYGSGQIMDHRQVVGAGYVGVKCKPLFVAPEVVAHAKRPTPRPGFLGPQADLWSVGVVLVQCVVWGFRGGPSFLTSNANWRKIVFAHIDAKCPDERACFLCQNFIVIPPLVGVIIKQLLHLDPLQRPSAYDVAMALQEERPPALFALLPPTRSRVRQATDDAAC